MSMGLKSDGEQEHMGVMVRHPQTFSHTVYTYMTKCVGIFEIQIYSKLYIKSKRHQSEKESRCCGTHTLHISFVKAHNY